MTKLEQLDQQIAELQKQKQIEELKIEIEKIKKTKLEETIIERRIIQEYPIQPFRPGYWYNGSQHIHVPASNALNCGVMGPIGV